MESKDHAIENKNHLFPNLQVGKLTIAELKTFSGCEHYTNDEAKEITDSLYQLAVILFDGTKFKYTDNYPFEDQNKAA